MNLLNVQKKIQEKNDIIWEVEVRDENNSSKELQGNTFHWDEPETVKASHTHGKKNSQTNYDKCC